MESDDAPAPQQPLGGDFGASQIGLLAGVRELYGRMSAARRRQFFIVLALMLLGAVAELATIGAVIPFIAVLADPGRLEELPWAVRLFEPLGADSERERLVLVTALFAAFALAAGILRILLTGMTQDFVFRLGHEVSVEIQRRILLQPYSFHIHTNTSAVLSAVHKIEILIFDLLLPMMQALTGGFIAAAIVAALIYLDPFAALTAAVGFSLIYLLVSVFTRKRLAANSAAMERAWDDRLKIIQESLGGIRDVIIDNSQSMYLGMFERVSARLSLARANTGFISSAPRFLIESIGMVVIAGIALAMSQRDGGLAAALPVLGALALGAQRLLPLLQQVYNGWSTAAGYRSVLRQIVHLLRLPVAPEHGDPAHPTPLPFKNKISFEQVSFGYPSRHRRAVENITVEIPCGSTAALVGETGSGKSTLVDLLMGLLEPDNGRICIDGVPLTQKKRRRWQRSIAHVPQSIFLADTSIARNIAFAHADKPIHLPRVIDAARKAQLHDFISALPDGYETTVGERGVRLSGGQRQLLGLARAIHKQASVLILDEPTSALDSATEAAVMDALHTLGDEGQTIIIISHRPSTIARCDMVVRLHKGRIVELGPAHFAGAGDR